MRQTMRIRHVSRLIAHEIHTHTLHSLSVYICVRVCVCQLRPQFNVVSINPN